MKSTSSYPCITSAFLPRLFYRLCGLATFLSVSLPTYAVNFGPDDMFSLKGFAEVTLNMTSNYCNMECQRVPGYGYGKYDIKLRPVTPGKTYESRGNTQTQFQPFLGATYDLGKGFRLSGVISQRWVNGMVDVYKAGSIWNGFWYEKDIGISHEDYGSLFVGQMTTRTRSIADFPYGTNLGLSWPWSGNGAGYGLLTNAVRYTSRLLDVAQGDLTLEATYDMGNTEFKTNKPSFWEFYGHYHRGDLVVDAMLQDAKNGTPDAWAQGYFTGLTPYPVEDGKLSESSQGIAMLMAKYQYNSQIELSGGFRHNRWSGANAVNTGTAFAPTWNHMFNVDWSGYPDPNRNNYPGYSATSNDLMLGVRYRVGKWVTSAGLIRFGTANTSNPDPVGQGNSALVGALGLQYDYGDGLKFNLQSGAVHFSQLGYSPMSLGNNSSINFTDSRVTQNSNWVTAGVVYGF